jgi:hypothetical protein
MCIKSVQQPSRTWSLSQVRRMLWHPSLINEPLLSFGAPVVRGRHQFTGCGAAEAGGNYPQQHALPLLPPIRRMDHFMLPARLSSHVPRALCNKQGRGSEGDGE